MDGSVSLWEVATGKVIRTFQASQRATVGSIFFSPDGKLAFCTLSATDGEPDGIKLWDVGTGQLIHSFPRWSEGWAGALAFSPDGTSAMLEKSDHAPGSSPSWQFVLWDIASAQEVRTFPQPSDGAMASAFSPDGKGFLVGYSDKTLKLWDVTSGKEVWSVEVDTATAHVYTFSPDGRLALSSTGSMTPGIWGGMGLKIWDAATGQLVRELQQIKH